MKKPGEELVIGILGQWASGKSTGAKTLINHLGGKDQVIFITDRELLATLAVNHILHLDKSKVRSSIDRDGKQQITGEHAIVCLEPGERKI